jgi:hypothetical protein
MIRPSCGTGCAKDACDLGVARREIFFAKGLDDPNQIDASGKIRFYVTVFFRAKLASEARSRRKFELICLTGKSESSGKPAMA